MTVVSSGRHAVASQLPYGLPFFPKPAAPIEIARNIAECYPCPSGPLMRADIREDEPLILLNMADIFAQEGFAVIDASSANEALVVIERNPSLCLVFTDVQMPGKLDGSELARIVSVRWPTMCVVVASGAAIPNEYELPTKARFLSKLVSPDVSHAILRDHCRLVH